MTVLYADERTRRIVSLIDNGFWLREVGDQFGITRERVRQIYKKATGHGVPNKGQAVIDRDAVRIRRFWASFRVADSGCWEWQGAIDPNGYGRSRRGSEQYSHRRAYAMAKGPIPSGLTIDHLCRNRACGNPAHLEAVSHRTNILRSPIQVAAVNARKVRCLHGHLFSDGNTRFTKDGARACRTCAVVRNRNAYALKKRLARASRSAA